MGKRNSDRNIRARRERILELLSRGTKQSDIARQLGVNRNTIVRDMKFLNDLNRKGLYSMAQQTSATLFFSCINGLNEALSACWNIAEDRDNPNITVKNRLTALSLIANINSKKLELYTQGPAILELDKMREEVQSLEEEALKRREEDNNNSFRPLPNEDLLRRYR